MSLLEIEGLTHSFGENLLYKNADFSLNRGEHIGVVGQNGTGKSTLIKICTEQIMPDAGRVTWQPIIRSLSKKLVGSSSNRTSGFSRSNFASITFALWPPLI